jgi:hypothetical protein
VTYTPAAGYAGADAFTYQVCDQTELCATAIVAVDVAAVAGNSAPAPADDVVATGKNVAVKVDVLANDTDPDGTADLVPSTVSVTSGPTHGSAVVGPDGLVTYTPGAGYVGSDSFRYQVCDQAGVCATARVSVQVVRVPEPPKAVDDNGKSPDGESIELDVVANDSDPQDSLVPSSVKVVQSAAHGTEKVRKGGTITYTPAAGYTGADKLRYQVCNAESLCSTAVVSITVQRPGVATPVDPAPEPPTATPIIRLGELAVTGAQLVGAFALGLLLLVGGGTAMLATAPRRRENNR